MSTADASAQLPAPLDAAVKDALARPQRAAGVRYTSCAIATCGTAWRQLMEQEFRRLHYDQCSRAADHVVALWLSQLTASSSAATASKATKFINFCTDYGRTAVPASLTTLCHYIGYLACEGRVSAAYFGQYLSAVRTLHKHLHQPCPPADEPTLQALLKAAAKAQRTEAVLDDRVPLPVAWVVSAVVHGLSTQEPCVVQLCTFFVIKSVFGLRGHSVLHLQRRHVIVSGCEIRLCLTHEKQRPNATTARSAVMPFPRAPGVLELVNRCLGLGQAGGGLWSELRGSGSELFQQFVSMMGIPQPAPPQVYQGHSTRMAFAAECRALGVPVEVFSQVAGWALGSASVWRYLRVPVEASAESFALFSGLLSRVLERQYLDMFGDVVILSDGICVL